MGLSQARLASLAHLSRATINALESGSTDLGIAKVLTIARILDLSLGFIDESSRHGGWLETAAASASGELQEVDAGRGGEDVRDIRLRG